ncbi:MAG TPA: hypothetical protein VJ824_03460 [Bacillota bacterium]|nr:hypothetical protein [Bacillota bacterium]
MVYPTSEDLQYVKKYAFLPLIYAVFSRDQKFIESSGIKTIKPYIEWMNGAIQRVGQDWVQTKKFFRKNGIKVICEQRDSHEITLSYLCRGYQYTAHYPLEFSRITVEEMMRTYLGDRIDV